MRCLAIVLILLSSCKQDKKYHDIAGKGDRTIMDTQLPDVLEFQQRLNQEFRDPETSPLPDRFRKNFESLEFFPPDTVYRVRAFLERTPEAIPFFMPTSTQRKSKERVYGILRFGLKGQRFELSVYQNSDLMQQAGYEDYLFLPFADRTNGKDTYGGGRYIDLRIPEGDAIEIDFNKAYNPYCAYNKKYSCPLVPVGNVLDIEIRAGVKAFRK